jgi:hypothetical protein
MGTESSVVQEFAPERVVVGDPPGHLASGQALEDVRNEVERPGPLPVGRSFSREVPSGLENQASWS